jgi:hypothetical protein
MLDKKRQIIKWMREILSIGGNSLASRVNVISRTLEMD